MKNIYQVTSKNVLYTQHIYKYKYKLLKQKIDTA